MTRRVRDNEPVAVKSTKKFRTDPEQTRVDEDRPEELGELKRFISNRKVIELLQKRGIQSLFPIQYTTYNIIFDGKDIKAKDKTGSGKTLAFSLPIIERFRKEKVFGSSKLPKYLIMLPTRQLVLQVVANIQNLRLDDEFSVVGIYGGEPIRNQTTKLSKGVDIAVATPGRLIDMVNRELIDFSDIQVTCLDEADEMLKQGFQEDIEKIFAAIQEKRKKKTQNLLFSATFPSWVNQISEKYQEHNCQMIDLVSKSAEMPSTIKHYLIQLADDNEAQEAIERLIPHFTSKQGKSIIFCETKRQVADLCEQLGKGCAMLHGDVKQVDREKVYRDFKSGKIITIVATNVAARGLDFPDIQLVVQTQPPKEVESFIHRSGRTGRAGKSGINVLLYTKRQRNTLEKIQSTSKIDFESLSLSDLKRRKK